MTITSAITATSVIIVITTMMAAITNYSSIIARTSIAMLNFATTVIAKPITKK